MCWNALVCLLLTVCGNTLNLFRPSVALFTPTNESQVVENDKLSTTGSSTTSLSPPQEQPIFGGMFSISIFIIVMLLNIKLIYFVEDLSQSKPVSSISEESDYMSSSVSSSEVGRDSFRRENSYFTCTAGFVDPGIIYTIRLYFTFFICLLNVH